MAEFKLYGRVFITADIRTLTGLHIGGSNTGLEIGGVDKTIIRNPLTRQPYIPGSSLRGKMRSQTEKINGMALNNPISKDVRIHSCQSDQEYKANGGCPVCIIFGVPADDKKVKEPTPARLVVRDVLLSSASLKKFAEEKIKSFSEIKTEVAIDRVTSQATPRSLERVPAEAVFGPAEFVFGIYETADYERLETVIKAMKLVEDDYLGGSGSRGSGKVKFETIEVSARKHDTYMNVAKFEKPFDSVQDLAGKFGDLKKWLIENVPITNVPAE
jgi:CRISPR-associated protein Csm3